MLLVLCEGDPPVTGGFPSQRASNVESIPISLRHHIFSTKPLLEPMITQSTDASSALMEVKSPSQIIISMG